jgi:hypothetical protein
LTNQINPDHQNDTKRLRKLQKEAVEALLSKATNNPLRASEEFRNERNQQMIQRFAEKI